MLCVGVRGYNSLVESEVLVMGRTSLNDLVYSFEPLEIVTPDSDYEADEFLPALFAVCKVKNFPA